MKKLGVKLSEMVNQEAEQFGLFLVHHTVSPTGLFRFYVDSQEILSMKALTDFTRHISELIDEGDFGEQAFTFEISSPGADNPLTDIRQFSKHVGRNFEVETTTETFKGKLIEIEGEQFTFEKEIKEKGKKATIEVVKISFETINKATIILSFK